MSTDNSTKAKRICEFPGCGKPLYAKKLCSGHYCQQWSGLPLTILHSTKKPKGTPPRIICDEVYCPNHDLFGPCHVFRGPKSKDGYVRIRAGGKKVSLHRYWWEREIGPIPEGMEIDHQCRQRACTNSDHLRVVTKQVNRTENVVGSFWMLNKAMTHCKRGHPFDEKSLMKHHKKVQRVCLICKKNRAIKRKEDKKVSTMTCG